MFNFAKRFAAFTALAAASFLASTTQAGFVHDYGSEFSKTNNPNGVWTYDGVVRGQLNSTRTTGSFDGGFGAWRGTPGDTFNLMFSNAFHPGQFSDNLVGFAYPEAVAGPVSVHLSFFDAQPACGGAGTTVSLWKNDSHIQDIAIPDTFSGNIVTDLVTNLSPGDVFFVRQTHNGDNNFCNNCGINSLTFTSTIPEPASMAMLLGLPAAGLIRRRK